MIELSREDTIEVLKALSQIDGYLLSIKDSGACRKLLISPVDLLTKLLIEHK